MRKLYDDFMGEANDILVEIYKRTDPSFSARPIDEEEGLQLVSKLTDVLNERVEKFNKELRSWPYTKSKEVMIRVHEDFKEFLGFLANNAEKKALRICTIIEMSRNNHSKNTIKKYQIEITAELRFVAACRKLANMLKT